ncbi:HTH domain-containing protein [Deinococcus pimensis]|uniref:HTH domain-containing protein n=1 Tax=Deinococcus pimensis TaxID=309888 RepID=UPI00048A19F2|nr:HTH domain-containing protein [Deinococcus pimensis]
MSATKNFLALAAAAMKVRQEWDPDAPSPDNLQIEPPAAPDVQEPQLAAPAPTVQEPPVPSRPAAPDVQEPQLVAPALDVQELPVSSRSVAHFVREGEVPSRPVRITRTVEAPVPPPPIPVEELLVVHTLEEGVRATFRALHEIALSMVVRRGYAVTPSTVVFHGSKELLAAVLGVSRTTLWRYLMQLKEVGLIDQRPHKGTSEGRTRNTGSVFKVALKSGARTTLLYEELHYPYRDLDADCAAGRTAYALLKQSKEDPETVIDMQVLKNWALGMIPVQNPVVLDCFMNALEVVEALPRLVSVGPRDRVALIGEMASTLCVGLRDVHSRDFYAWMLTRAVRVESQGIRMLSKLQCVLRRLVIAARPDEWRDLRRPGAMVVRELAAELEVLRAS